MAARASVIECKLFYGLLIFYLSSSACARMDVKLKERGSNFSSKELELLKRLIDEKKHVLLCKKTDAVSQGQKEKTWVKIHMEFNASNSRHRTIKQLKYKFDNMKKCARKEASKERQERRRTGGGQIPGTSNSDPDKDWLKSLIVLSANGLDSTYDDDALPVNDEPTGGEGNLANAYVNFDETIESYCVMPPQEENSQDMLLLSHDMIVKQPSHTPSPSSQFKMTNTDVVTLIPSGEMENVRPFIKDTGAPGCLLRRPVSSPLKCQKKNIGATPVSVRRSIKKLSEEKLHCTKEKERILDESNRRAEVEHSEQLRHTQELHDQLLKHNEERHQKEIHLLDLKIKIHEAQLKTLL